MTAHLPTRRHVLSPHRTTVMLESAFWDRIDRLAESAGCSWRQWVTAALTDKPAGIGAAGWLRVRCLIESSSTGEDRG